jgi:hypothetical protein
MDVTRTRGRRRAVILVAAAVTLLVVGAGCSRGATPNKGASGGASGAAFYRGKTLTVVVNPPGNTLYGECS